MPGCEPVWTYSTLLLQQFIPELAGRGGCLPLFDEASQPVVKPRTIKASQLPVSLGSCVFLSSHLDLPLSAPFSKFPDDSRPGRSRSPGTPADTWTCRPWLGQMSTCFFCLLRRAQVKL